MTTESRPAKGVAFGYDAGEVCKRNGCTGVIQERPVEGCSCHINPPCGACTTPNEYCPVCDWEAKNDRIFNDYVVNEIPGVAQWKAYEPRRLDNTKIDWRFKPHTHFTMIKEGVYPEGTSMAQVEKEVRGTFGGRFNSFGNGRFEYVAYTD